MKKVTMYNFLQNSEWQLGIVAANNMAGGLIRSHHNLLQQLSSDGQVHKPILCSETTVMKIWCNDLFYILEYGL
jgi:hypothetical protein